MTAPAGAARFVLPRMIFGAAAILCERGGTAFATASIESE
jgi:hypothetical protein